MHFRRSPRYTLHVSAQKQNSDHHHDCDDNHDVDPSLAVPTPFDLQKLSFYTRLLRA